MKLDRAPRPALPRNTETERSERTAVRRALIIRHGCGGLHEFSELRALILRLRYVYLMTSLCSYIIHSWTRVVLPSQLKQSDDVASGMAKGNVGTVSVYASNMLS